MIVSAPPSRVGLLPADAFELERGFYVTDFLTSHSWRKSGMVEPWYSNLRELVIYNNYPRSSEPTVATPADLLRSYPYLRDDAHLYTVMMSKTLYSGERKCYIFEWEDQIQF